MDAAVHVMMEVLDIDYDQASFFLESAANDVAVAVDLHFELIGASGKRARGPQAFSAFRNGHVPSGLGAYGVGQGLPARWRRVQVKYSWGQFALVLFLNPCLVGNM